MIGGIYIYIELILKCILYYFIMISALRIMGKREIGELSIFDLAIFLVISEMLAIALSEHESNFMKALLPILTLTLLQMLISFIFLKSQSFRNIVDGKASIIMYQGKILQHVMRKQRYNLDDLFSQLRIEGCNVFEDIDYAILENNGSLSIIRKCDNMMHPFPVIQDGVLNKDVLKDLNQNEEWLLNQIAQYGFSSIQDIFVCVLYKQRIICVAKEKTK